MDAEKRPETPSHEESAELQATEQDGREHTTSKWQAIKENPRAFAWCLYAIWTSLLVSFDNQASGLVFGIPQFRKDFGNYYNGQYVLDAAWQSAFTGGPLASNLVACLASGQIADKIGRRYTILGALVVSYAAVTLQVVATKNEVFFGGKFLNGFVTGTLSTVCLTYLGEITPLPLRGLLTCMVALTYTVGPLICALIMNETGTYTNPWAYRAMFCSQYAFSSIAAVFIWFLPESPWWLAAKGRDDRALRSLQRLGYRDGEDSRRMAQIKITLEKIHAETEGTTFLECFRYSNMRRTIISVAPYSIQALAGVVFVASYTLYYIQLAGYSDDMSFKLQIVQQIVSTVGSVMSWFVIDRVGRRNTMLWGTIGLAAILLICGGCATVGNLATTKVAVAMLLLYCWFYNTNIGACANTITCEVSTSRLRVKTIALAISLQNIVNIFWNFLLPFLFNPDQANLGARVTFIFGGLAVLCVVFLWFYQPETAGRSYEELDEMFMKKVPARKFKGYKTDVQKRVEGMEERL